MTYNRKGNLLFAARLRLETHEIFFQETYGKSEKTSLCLLFSTSLSLRGSIFKSAPICQ